MNTSLKISTLLLIGFSSCFVFTINDSGVIAQINQQSLVKNNSKTTNLQLTGRFSDTETGLIAQFAPPEIAEKAKKMTVIINGQNPGSGVIIGKQNNTYFVLTAKHVVATEDEYEIVTNDGQQYSLDYRTVRKLPEVDLALVQFTSNQNYSVAQIGDSDAATEGQGIYISGWPHPGQAITDRIFQITTGYISGRAFGVAEDGYELVYTNITRSGMSGGAVFDTEGRLIGIHGRAEGQAIYNPDTGDNIEIKSGFNLGIPIKIFIEQIPPESLPENPSFAYALSSWGSEFLRQNKLDRARADFEKALRIAPQSFLALFGMAQIKYQQNQMSEALRLFQSGINIDSENREVKSTLKWGENQLELIAKLAEALTIYQMGDRDRGLALASALFANGEYPLDALWLDWPLEMASNPNPNYNFNGSNDFLITMVKEYIWSQRLRSDAKEMLAYLIPQADRSFSEKVFFEEVIRVFLSKNGTIMATGGHDHPIKIWEISSGNQLRTIAENSDSVNSFVLSEDGKTLVSSSDNRLKVWDVSSGQEVSQITGDFSWVNSLGISSHGKMLVTVNDWEDIIQVWQIGSPTEVSRLSGYSEDVEAIAFSPDRQLLATGHDQGTIRVWDLRSGQELRTLSGHSAEEVSYLLWSSDAKTLVSSSWDETVKVWDLESGKERHTFPGWVSSPIALSPNGQLLAVGNTNAGIQLWDLRTGELMRTWRWYNPLILKSLSFNGDGSQIVSVYSGIDENSPDSSKIWQVRL